MQQYIIGNNEAGQRLDKFLNKYMPNAGSSFIYKMLRKKNITCNRHKMEGKEILAVGDSIETFFSDETYVKMRGISYDKKQDSRVETYRKAYQTLQGIQVLYEDNDFVFLNKPTGILSQQAEPGSLSVNEWLIGYLMHEGKIDENQLQTFHPSVCNRIDRNTSGLVLCAKSLPGAQLLGKLLSRRTMHKYYRCIVCGNITDSIRLSGYLYKDEKTNKVFISDTAKEGYDPILTAYMPVTKGNHNTELEVELVTGKTHQIRAHLSSIGHPLLGDPKYGDKSINRDYGATKGQLLHAYRVVFPNADEDEDISAFPNIAGREFICPKPAYFAKYIR